MRDLIKVLQQAFTKEFYRLNAMFFLLVCGLAFGFMSGVEHKALAEFITSTPVMTLIPTALWILYGTKILSFNSQVCRMREMSFVHLLSLIPTQTQFLCSVSVVTNQLFPAIAYGIFLIVVAIKNQVFVSAFCIAAALLSLILLLSIHLFRRIGSIEGESRVSIIKKWMDRSFEKSFVQFFVEWLSRNHPGIILFTKVFGCSLVFAVCQLYKYDEYDYRLLALGCLAALGGSLVIAHQYVLFENHRFEILRNLPMALSRRMYYFVLSMAFICLPEFIFLIRNFPDQLPAYHFVEISIFIVSIFILGYVILLRLKNNLERFSGRIFVLFMLLVIIILFSISLYVLAGLALGMSALLYPKGFYEFEVEETPVDQPVEMH